MERTKVKELYSEIGKKLNEMPLGGEVAYNQQTAYVPSVKDVMNMIDGMYHQSERFFEVILEDSSRIDFQHEEFQRKKTYIKMQIKEIRKNLIGALDSIDKEL